MNKNTAAAKSAATKALRTCRCGCGAPLGGKAAYRPGHDARHVSNLKRDLENAAASSDRSPESTERIQGEVYAIFSQLKSDALRAKLGRAVDNDKEGLYNSFGDMGVFVPYSENPSLGGNRSKDQAAFEANSPAEAPKAKKAKDSAPAVADEPWITHQPIEEETATVPEPMWTENEAGDWDEAEIHADENTPPALDGLEVKIGRWTYPARRNLTGKLQRNLSRDGSGDWVPADEMDLFRS